MGKSGDLNAAVTVLNVYRSLNICAAVIDKLE